MNQITLIQMNKELARRFFHGFERDPALFQNPELMKPYFYDQATADNYYERQKEYGRIHLAIMLHNEPVGEILLKDLDYRKNLLYT